MKAFAFDSFDTCCWGHISTWTCRNRTFKCHLAATPTFFHPLQHETHPFCGKATFTLLGVGKGSSLTDEIQMASPWSACLLFVHVQAHACSHIKSDKPSNVLDVTQLPSRKLVLSFVAASGCLALMAEWSWVAYTVLEVLIAAACCFGNVLVMCAVCFGIRDSLREPTFCFLVSLAVADFLVGVAAVPLAVLLDGWVSLIPELCLLLSCVVLVLTQASVLSLLAIAVDRYLRLHTPLRWGELWVSCFVSEHCDIFRFSLLLCFIPLSDTKPWPHKGTHGSACLFAGCFHVSLASLLYSAGTITPPQHLIPPTHLPLLSSVRRALSSQLSPSLSWSTSTFSDVSWHPCWSWPSSTLESFGAYRDV